MFEKVRIIRYIGNKTNLYNFIVPEILKELDTKENFYEFFSGTNAISFKINEEKKYNIYANDISLYSQIIFEILNIRINDIDVEKLVSFMKYIDNINIETLIKKLNISDFDITNELSMGGIPKTINKDIFKNQEYKSRMYFPYVIGQKIDVIRYLLKVNNLFSLNEKEKILILNMLLNYADKHANTTGVYGAFLKKNKVTKFKPFYNKTLFNEIIKYIEKYNNTDTIQKQFFRNDVLNVIQDNNINDAVIYMDPPYNTRDYQTNYHILNYIVNLDFTYKDIKPNSKTAVPRNELRIKNISSSKDKIYENLKFILKKLNIRKNNNTVFVSYSSEGILSLDDYKKIAKELKYNINIKKQKYRKYKSQIKSKEWDNKVEEYLIKFY